MATRPRTGEPEDEEEEVGGLEARYTQRRFWRVSPGGRSKPSEGLKPEVRRCDPRPSGRKTRSAGRLGPLVKVSGPPDGIVALSAKSEKPTQKTKPKKGEPVEIPVPTRGDFDDLVRKVA